MEFSFWYYPTKSWSPYDISHMNQTYNCSERNLILINTYSYSNNLLRLVETRNKVIMLLDFINLIIQECLFLFVYNFLIRCNCNFVNIIYEDLIHAYSARNCKFDQPCNIAFRSCIKLLGIRRAFRVTAKVIVN